MSAASPSVAEATDQAFQHLASLAVPYTQHMSAVEALRDALMAEAQALYGPRDASWTIGPTVFVANVVPRLALVSPQREMAQIILTGCQIFPEEVAFQLAHEVVNTLSPTTSPILNINEGLAAHFSVFVM